MSSTDHTRAFPGKPKSLDGSLPGMDLRDWFAGKALPTLLEQGMSEMNADTTEAQVKETLAAAVGLSFHVADCMMSARSASTESKGGE